MTPDPRGTAERRLPRINGRVDVDTLVAIFMGRQVEHLSRLMTRAAFDALSRDFTSWLAPLFEDIETEASRAAPDREYGAPMRELTDSEAAAEEATWD